MIRVEVVVTEHGQELRYVVAEEPSLDTLRELIERLKAYFGESDRVRVVGESSGYSVS